MPIINSTYIAETAAPDGSRRVIEVHTDDKGGTWRIDYLADAGMDYATVATTRVAQLNTQLKETELRTAIFDGAWNYVLSNVTANELAAYVRELYKNESKEQLARVAKRILEWITNGRFTDTQIRTVFGLTAAQWTTLKTKMQTLVSNYDALNTAAGE